LSEVLFVPRPFVAFQLAVFAVTAVSGCGGSSAPKSAHAEDAVSVTKQPESVSTHSFEPTAPPPSENPYNEFSGPEYRIINFVADLPLRVDRLLSRGEPLPEDTHVVFMLTEFQIADKATALHNESGASSHEAYKARQNERVRMRLFREKDDPLPPD